MNAFGFGFGISGRSLSLLYFLFVFLFYVWQYIFYVLQRAGFSFRCLVLLQSKSSRRRGFSSCGVWAQQLWRSVLAAPQYVRSSWTRDENSVPCIAYLYISFVCLDQPACPAVEELESWSPNRRHPQRSPLDSLLLALLTFESTL